jgi:hypothetical protein
MSTQLHLNKTSFPGVMSPEMASPAPENVITAKDARRVCLRVAINSVKTNEAVSFDEEIYDEPDDALYASLLYGD